MEREAVSKDAPGLFLFRGRKVRQEAGEEPSGSVRVVDVQSGRVLFWDVAAVASKQKLQEHRDLVRGARLPLRPLPRADPRSGGAERRLAGEVLAGTLARQGEEIGAVEARLGDGAAALFAKVVQAQARRALVRAEGGYDARLETLGSDDLQSRTGSPSRVGSPAGRRSTSPLAGSRGGGPAGSPVRGSVLEGTTGSSDEAQRRGGLDALTPQERQVRARKEVAERRREAAEAAAARAAQLLAFVATELVAEALPAEPSDEMRVRAPAPPARSAGAGAEGRAGRQAALEGKVDLSAPAQDMSGARAAAARTFEPAEVDRCPPLGRQGPARAHPKAPPCLSRASQPRRPAPCLRAALARGRAQGDAVDGRHAHAEGNRAGDRGLHGRCRGALCHRGGPAVSADSPADCRGPASHGPLAPRLACEEARRLRIHRSQRPHRARPQPPGRTLSRARPPVARGCRRAALRDARPAAPGRSARLPVPAPRSPPLACRARPDHARHPCVPLILPVLYGQIHLQRVHPRESPRR